MCLEYMPLGKNSELSGNQLATYLCDLQLTTDELQKNCP